MANRKKILRPPSLAMNVATSAGNQSVSSIHIKKLQGDPETYICNLLDSGGKILKKDHECIRGKQPFRDLTDGEISSLTPKKESSSTQAEEPTDEKT